MPGTPPSRKKPSATVSLLRDNVARLLLLNKRSAAQLSDHLGVSRSWLSRLLRGRRQMVSMWYLDEIAGYFGVDVYELFTPVRAPAVVRQFLSTSTRLKELAPRRTTPKKKGGTAIQRAAAILRKRR